MAKKEKVKKSFAHDLIAYIVSISCLLLCLYITTKVIYGNMTNRPPKVFNLCVSYVPTDSMDPTIKSGEYVLFSGTNYDMIVVGDGTISENHKNKTGDIVVYYNSVEKKLILHRAVEKGSDSEGRYIICQGDNDSTNPIPDTDGKGGYYKVRESELCGKYMTTLAFMSLFSGGVNTNVVFIIIIVIFIIMIAIQVVSMVVKVKSDKLKEEKEKEEAKQKELLREEIRNEILKEELARLKALNNQKKDE